MSVLQQIIDQANATMRDSRPFFGLVLPAYTNSLIPSWPLQEEQEGRIDNELAVVLSSIAVACKQIASMVNRAGISNLTGAAGEQNFSGEDQKKLDVVSNEVFSNCLRASGRTVSVTNITRSNSPCVFVLA